MSASAVEPVEQRVCANSRCATSSSSSAWKQGWILRSGLSANLCGTCGVAFEESRFCEAFHFDDAGWRTCNSCKKRVHCGCIASIHAFVLLDGGGVECITCAETQDAEKSVTPGASRSLTQITSANRLGSHESERLRAKNLDGKFNGRDTLSQTYPNGQDQISFRKDGSQALSGELSLNGVSGKDSLGPSTAGTVGKQMKPSDSSGFRVGTISSSDLLGGPTTSSCLSSPMRMGDCRDALPRLSSPSANRSREKQNLPHPFNSLSSLPESGSPLKSVSELHSAVKLPRPSGESKGRSQLLPRYWPRITDQEMQQLTSGDSNAIIIPLFEKMLSASDAGRIGRLVLPKACAEAYFPPISSPEGIPIDIHDVSGKKWTFQFRYWPNNNSRMYVLEGVTPCIQAMSLQAGDTVTFSRLDPGGKLVMGYRRASNSAQEFSLIGPGSVPSRNSDGQSAKEFSITPPDQVNKMKTFNVAGQPNSVYPWDTMDSTADRKKGRPLGAKSKRLRLDSADALELKITWEKAQELLRPPPGVIPSIVTVDGQEFEEYEDPPIMEKKTTFAAQPLGAACHSPQETSDEDADNLLHSISGFGADSSTSPPLPTVTTKHPRHRPGCTCIVCIQPPSGKGPKHKPNCICNVCMTVKRRFKTLMMRRKKRESDREAETARKRCVVEKSVVALDDNSNPGMFLNTYSGNTKSRDLMYREGLTGKEKTPDGRMIMASKAHPTTYQGYRSNTGEKSSGKDVLDPNIQPDDHEAASRLSMMRLLHNASLPLDLYLQQGMLAIIPAAPGGAPTLNGIHDARAELSKSYQHEVPTAAEDALESSTRVKTESAAISCTEVSRPS